MKSGTAVIGQVIEAALRLRKVHCLCAELRIEEYLEDGFVCTRLSIQAPLSLRADDPVLGLQNKLIREDKKHWEDKRAF